MIIEVTETNYMGFHLEYVEDKGWKIILGDVEYLFPHLQAAQIAIEEIHDSLAKDFGAKKSKIKRREG